MLIGAANVDIVHPGGGSYGSVAQRMLSQGLTVNALRTNEILRKEEWKLFDDTVINVARERLVITGDLFARGLTMPVGNAMGTTIVEWEGATHMEGAQVNMSGITPGRGDRVEFNLHSVPLPIIHKDFELNIRHLEASRTLGAPIDTTQAAQAARIVSETIEGIIIDGHSMVVGSSQIYGIKTHPDRNTATIGDWTSVSGETMVDDTITMINAAAADNYFGPFVMYVPLTVFNRMQDDYATTTTTTDRTILERLLAIDQIVAVRPSQRLISTEVILVQMSSDVIDLIDGIQPTVVMWESNGGFTVNFKVMAIIIPRVKSTETNQSGIVHGT